MWTLHLSGVLDGTLVRGVLSSINHYWGWIFSQKFMSLEGVWYEVDCKVIYCSNQTPSKLITFVTKNSPSAVYQGWWNFTILAVFSWGICWGNFGVLRNIWGKFCFLHLVSLQLNSPPVLPDSAICSKIGYFYEPLATFFGAGYFEILLLFGILLKFLEKIGLNWFSIWFFDLWCRYSDFSEAFDVGLLRFKKLFDVDLFGF